MIKIFTILLLVIVVNTNQLAHAKKQKPMSVASQPSGALVTITKSKSNKELDRCITPCKTNIPTKKDFTVRIFKHYHSAVELQKQDGIDKNGVLTFTANLKLEKPACNPNYNGHDPSDKNAKPLVRRAPNMPENITKQGSCNIIFDVSVAGRAVNAKAESCTDNIFAKPAIDNVQKTWLFVPRVIKGCSIMRRGVEAKVNFK